MGRRCYLGRNYRLCLVYWLCIMNVSMKREINQKTGHYWNNLTGDVYGRWTVIECVGRLVTVGGKSDGATVWRCRCECGAERTVNYGALRSGVSKSCGCLRREVLNARALKHGDSRCKAYVAWQQAQQRCFNPERPCWNNYGGRGVTMCDGLKGDYVKWREVLGPAPSLKHSVDRRDNNGNYSCGSCSHCQAKGWKLNIHWATRGEQNSNRRSNRHFSWKGQIRNITEIARMENVAFCSLRNRLIMDRMPVTAAVDDLRARGLTFNERAQCILEANPAAPVKAPNRRYKKSVPAVDKSVPNK